MDKTAIAENLDRLSVGFQAVIEAAAELKSQGSIEAHTAALETARQRAIEAKTQADADLATAQEKLEQAKQDAKDLLRQAEGAVAKAVADGQASVDQILADAKAKAVQAADEITKSRQEELNRLLDEIERQKGVAFDAKNATELALGEKVLAERGAKEAQASLDAVLDQISALPGKKPVAA